MTRRRSLSALSVVPWNTAIPLFALLVLGMTWGLKDPPLVMVLIVGAFLAGAVLAAVHHAEVVAHRVGESLNLGFGSAMASIGLTIPVIAIASIWLDGPLILGLGETQLVLLVLTAIVATLTVVPGRATLQQAGVHLVLFGAFAFLAANP